MTYLKPLIGNVCTATAKNLESKRRSVKPYFRRSFCSCDWIAKYNVNGVESVKNMIARRARVYFDVTTHHHDNDKLRQKRSQVECSQFTAHFPHAGYENVRLISRVT